MTEREKAGIELEWDHINLRRDRREKEQFMYAYNGHKARTGNQPTQGEFLMILLGQWERRKEEV